MAKPPIGSWTFGADKAFVLLELWLLLAENENESNAIAEIIIPNSIFVFISLMI